MKKYNVVLVYKGTHYKLFDTEENEIYKVDTLTLDEAKDWWESMFEIFQEEQGFAQVKTSEEQDFCDYIKVSNVDKVYLKEVKE